MNNIVVSPQLNFNVKASLSLMYVHDTRKVLLKFTIAE